MLKDIFKTLNETLDSTGNFTNLTAPSYNDFWLEIFKVQKPLLNHVAFTA